MSNPERCAATFQRSTYASKLRCYEATGHYHEHRAWDGDELTRWIEPNSETPWVPLTRVGVLSDDVTGDGTSDGNSLNLKN